MDQFLQFGADGTFIRNLYKKGQGPGEIQDYFQFCITEDRIFVYDVQPGKLLCFDFEGSLINEIRFKERYGDFHGFLDKKLLFLKRNWPPREERTGDYFLIENCICHVGIKGGQLLLGESFPTKVDILPGGGARFYPLASARSASGRLLYFNSTTDYVIDVIDLADGRILRCFSRDYRSVGRPEAKNKPKRPSGYQPPRYLRDIDNLFIHKDSLWVATSYHDPEKGRQFDVFDEEGVYRDSFYIGASGTVYSVFENHLFTVERDEDGLCTVVKYRFLFPRETGVT